MILFPYYKYLYVLNPHNKPFSINFFEKGKLSFSEKFLRIDVSNVDYLDLVLTNSSQSYNFLDVLIEYNDYKDINYTILSTKFYYDANDPSVNQDFTVEYVYNKIYYKKSVPKVYTTPNANPLLKTVVYLLRDGELLCVHENEIKNYDYILFRCDHWYNLLLEYNNVFWFRNNFCGVRYIWRYLGDTKPTWNNLPFYLFDYRNVDFIKLNFRTSVDTNIGLGCYTGFNDNYRDYYLIDCPSFTTNTIHIYPIDRLAFYIFSTYFCTIWILYNIHFKPFLYVEDYI